MKYYIGIEDKQGDETYITVNALSIDHALSKAEKFADKKDIWKKEIRASKKRPAFYENVYFTPVTIK